MCRHSYAILFIRLLLDHLKRFTISDAGAVLLRRCQIYWYCILILHFHLSDLKLYAETMGSIGPSWPNLKDRFELLTEIGNMFLVRPENLKSLMQEGILSAIDPKLLYPFLLLRADFKTARVDEIFPDAGSGLAFTKVFD
jgi:exocyst complex component 5